MARALKIVQSHDSRAYTCAVLELVDEELLDKDQLIQELLGWMSEYEVQEFCKKILRDEDNLCLIREEDEEDEEDEEECEE